MGGIDLRLIALGALAIAIIGLIAYARRRPAARPPEPFVDSIMEQGYEAVRRAKEQLEQERQQEP